MKTIKLSPMCTVALASQKTLTAQEIAVFNGQNGIHAARKRFARVFFVAASALLISAVLAQAAAEIDLQQPLGVSIADGGSKDFGTVVFGTDKTLTFTIRNTGNAVLNLTGNPRVVIGGTHAADFTVISQPASSLPAAVPGGPVTVLNSGFETPVQGGGGGYTYNPTGAGWAFTDSSGVARNATPWFYGRAAEGSQAGFIYDEASISQVLNFPAPGVYVIRFYMIRPAEGSPNTIDVRMDGSTIGTVLSSEQSDDLWRTFEVPYTCTVAGNHTLAFVGTLTINGSFASSVDNVQVFPKIYETPFQVRFAPGGGGTRTATLSIANDDSNENPYNLTLMGTTPIQTKIAIEQPVGARLTNGMVRSWGCNSYGQSDVPPGLVNVKGITAGQYHVVAVKADRTVAAWGLSSFADAPVDLSNVAAVAAGAKHTMALRTDGTIVVWGDNTWNQTVVPAGLTDAVAIAAANNSCVALRSNGTVVTWGYPYGVQPAGLTDVKAIARGMTHTLTLRSNGTVVAWGQNFNGEADVPAGLANVVAISAEGYGSAAVKSDGTIVQWGHYSPAPAGLTSVVALTSSLSHMLALRNDATIVGWGLNTCGQANVPADVVGVRAIAAASIYPNGGGQSVALLDSTVNFGNQAVGTAPATKTFTIRNTGLAPLTISGVSMSGGDAANFTVNTSGMLTTISTANGTTTFTVTFTPGSTGQKHTTLRVMNNEPDQGTFYVHLTGTGVPAVPEIAVFNGATTNAANERFVFDSYGFPNTDVGSNSAVQIFTVKNIGTANLTGLALTKTGANTPDFVVGSLGATSLAPQATTTFTVTFVPAALGTRNAMVNLASNDGDENPFGINVSGLGTPSDALALVEASIPSDTIAATSANSPAGYGATNAIDNNATTKYLNFDKLNTGMTITPAGQRPVQALTLISAEDAPERDPSSFVFEGSNNGTTFTRIASNAVPAFATRHFVQSVAFPNANVFNIYRVLFPTISNPGSADSMQIAEVELLHWPEISSPNDAVSITLPPGAVDVRGVGSLFDRQLDGIHKLEVAPFTSGATVVNIIPAAGATVLKGFELIGANDDFTFQQRRPSSVAVAGSVDGINYTNLVTITPAAPSANLQIQEFSTSSNTMAFARYRITFGPPVSGDRLQIGEMRLFGDLGIAPEIAVFTGATTNAGLARTDNLGTNVFVNTGYGSNSAVQTFTIKNTGRTNLTGLALAKTGVNPGDFVLGSLGSTTLAPQATTTFTVTFAPTAIGARRATVDIASNDGDENPFSIHVSGTGTATEASALLEASIPGDTAIGTSTNSASFTMAPKAIDNDVTTKYLNFDKLNTGMTITPTGKRPVRALTLISAEDAPERDPSSFVLEGSNNGTNFTRIASEAVPAFPTRNFIQSFAVANTNVFNQYRVLFPTVSNAAAANSMQIAEIELLYNQEITSTNDTLSLTLPPGATDVRGVGTLFDRQLALLRKFEVWTLGSSNAVVDITPAAGTTVLKGFELIGAADDFTFPQRRPSSVTMAGSNDGTNYTTLATVIPVAPTANLQIQEFATPSNATAFVRYRITFGPPVSGTVLQVGEMRLFGADLPPPVLSIHASGNNVLVSWPNVSGFGLESKSALTNATWTPVGVAPVVGNGVNTVTLPTSERSTFFRLRQ